MRPRSSGGGLLGAIALAIVIVIAPPAQAQDPPVLYEFDHNHAKTDPRRGDFGESYVFGGFRFRWNPLDLEIRGRNFLFWTDREATAELLQHPLGGGSRRPPRRGMEAPPPRRKLTPAVMHERLRQLLGALGQTPPRADQEQLTGTEVPRFLYFEGDVLVFSAGIEVARCERLWIAPQDNRIVIEDAELRYRSAGREHLIIVRGDRIVKQGARWTGRDLQVTSCEAGEPHVSVVSGELEIVERDDQFEIWSRGNMLQLGGISVAPIPDAHFFTGEQNQIPLKGASGGYSEKEGMRARIELGMPWNHTGGALHELITGRPAQEFRGDWRLGLGWIETRGSPLDGEWTYRARDREGRTLYEGATEAFYLDDNGPNLREIRTNIDGSLITDRNRNLLQTRNRVRLGDSTHLDVTAFYAGDAAVYSEFFRGEYHDAKTPETSAYLHHGDGNVLFTMNGRYNLSEFSYRDNRALAPFFVEELPVATLNWLAQPIATTPWDTPIVLDAATEIGQRRRNFDPRAPRNPPGPTNSDRTLRVDQVVELSAPFLLGPVSVRPYGSSRITWYDAATDGDPAGRSAFTAGLRMGTRMSRSWHWLDNNGEEQGLRHVVAPLLTFANRFQVQGEPADYRQFDDVDALTESNLVRIELRNLVQRMGNRTSMASGTTAPNAPGEASMESPHDIMLLDLAQDFWPDANRDNSGEELGLFYYDFLVRPNDNLTRLPNLGLAIYGDHDWQTGLRTFDSEVRFGELLGADWQFTYRRDEVVAGALGMGAYTRFLGRWSTYGRSNYDFEEQDWRSYQVGIRRDDHDWSLLLSLDYDPFSDEVTFRLAFEPKLAGLTRLHDRTWPRDSFGSGPGVVNY